MPTTSQQRQPHQHQQQEGMINVRSLQARPRKKNRSSLDYRFNIDHVRAEHALHSNNNHSSTARGHSDSSSSLQSSPLHRDPASELADTYRGLCAPGIRFESNPSRLLTTKRQHRPVLWIFVDLFAHPNHWYLSDAELQNRHAAFAFCKECKLSIYFVTSNQKVLPHMTKYHEAEMTEYEEQERQAQHARLARTLTSAFDEAGENHRTITSEQQEHVNMLLARWIAAHFRPLILIEDEGFLEFVAYVTLNLGNVILSVPKRTQLRGYIVIFAGDLRAEVRGDITKSCLYFSMTSDIWTARNARSYISVTIHYVNDMFEPRNWTLEVIELPGIHTGEIIAAKLKEVIDKWDLSLDNCTRFVHDSGSNIVKAAELLGFENTSCLAHDIHLVVSGALSKTKKSSETETPDWTSIVDEESDSTTNVYECDNDLNENERWIDFEI
ncbi:hypothetical protein GN958_ATG16591 [Phytophthora infestans]|uniref:BED-type domain-containing protein n=1 Tax=Phytophthora infestans TaxID=4787 RepID=A0A8S9U0U5_PHYIN|nr:hypothetical protein GN958_ATG16591 [Phytophthora infestans]